MKREFPRHVFAVPGPLSRAGGTYAEATVVDQAEHTTAIKAGWFDTMLEAIEEKADPVKAEAARLAREAAATERLAAEVEASCAEVGASCAANLLMPTRKELEEKAAELGISFAPNIGDARLLERIQIRLECAEPEEPEEPEE